MGGIERVYYMNGMHVVTGNECQKLWDLIDENTMYAALHGAKKVIIKALHFNHLVNKKDNNLPCLGLIINNSSIDYGSML